MQVEIYQYIYQRWNWWLVYISYYLESLNKTFSLTICSRMVSCIKGMFDIVSFAKRLEFIGGELNSIYRNDLLWNAMDCKYPYKSFYCI